MEAQTHPLEHTQHEHKEHAHQECGCGCGCGCCELHIGEDVDEEEERRERRRTVLRLSIGAALLIAGWFTPRCWSPAAKCSGTRSLISAKGSFSMKTF